MSVFISKLKLKLLIERLNREEKTEANKRLLTKLLAPESVKLCTTFEFEYKNDAYLNEELQRLFETELLKTRLLSRGGSPLASATQQCIPLKMLPPDLLEKIQKTQVADFLKGTLSIIDLYSFMIAISNKETHNYLIHLLNAVLLVCNINLFFQDKIFELKELPSKGMIDELKIALENPQNNLHKIEFHIRQNGVKVKNASVSAKKVLTFLNVTKQYKEIQETLLFVKDGKINLGETLKYLEQAIKEKTVPVNAIMPQRAQLLVQNLRKGVTGIDYTLQDLIEKLKTNGPISQANAAKSVNLLSKVQFLVEELTATQYLVDKLRNLFDAYEKALEPIDAKAKEEALYNLKRFLEDHNEYMISEQEIAYNAYG